MGILALFAVFFSAAVFLFVYLRAAVLPLCLSAAALLPLSFLLCFRHRNGRKRFFRALPFCLLALLCGIARSFYQETRLEERCAPYDGRTLIADVTVKGIPQSSEYGRSVTVEVGGLDCCLACDRDFDFSPGERLRILASFRRTDGMKNGSRYLTAGIPLYAEYETAPLGLGRAERQYRFLPARLGLWCQNRIRTIYPEDSAALLLAILTGSRSMLNENTGFLADLRLCGASHSIAISGMHVSYLTGLLYFLLGRRRYASALCIPVLLVFMGMTGFSPSVVRAGVMQLALCAAQLSGRDYDSPSALFYALMLLLMINPQCCGSAALQLSFSAALGINLFAHRMTGAWSLKRKLPKPAEWLHKTVSSTVAVTLGALAFSAPLSLILFRQMSLLAPVSSLLLLWSISLCFSLGLIGLLLSTVSTAAAGLTLLPLKLLTAYLSGAARLLGKIPLSTVSVQTKLPLVWLLSLYAVIPAVVLLKPILRKTRMIVLYAAVGFALGWLLELYPVMRGELRYALLDVGQGQCAVVVQGSGTVMIDCGGGIGTEAGDAAADYLGSLCRFSVDALILSHYHSDHTNGIGELARRVNIKRVYAPAPELGDEGALRLLGELKAAGIPVSFVSASQTLSFGELKNTLIPPEGGEKDNEACLAVLTEFRGFSAWTTGDAGFRAELGAAERAGVSLPDILVVGHHGSAGSCSEEYLLRVMPGEAYISAGPNRYGLPSAETLERLERLGIPTRRTDLEGSLVFRYGREKA